MAGCPDLSLSTTALSLRYRADEDCSPADQLNFGWFWHFPSMMIGS